MAFASRLLVMVLGLGVPLADLRADDAAATQPAETKAAPEAAAGLLPVPDYSGDLWNRPFLTGDWGGTRTDWANKGIQLDVNFTQTVQSVVRAGNETGTKYGGTLDYNGKLDLMRMGVMPGALVNFRAETRYGESVNDIAGPILPVNGDAFFPLTNELDEDVSFTITSLNYMQFLSEQIGFIVGKIDTADGDGNEFASGRGTSQFLNASFIFSPALLPVAPYSTLAAGLVVMPNKYITIQSLVYNLSDSSTTTGFDDFGEGGVSLTEARFQYQLFDLSGGANVGFGYAFDADFIRINERFTFRRGQGIAFDRTDETWSLYLSGWQYVWEAEHSDAPINVGDGVPDRAGIGLFWRVGTGDDDTNPFKYTLSGGVGGKGIIPTRERDHFGIGGFYNHFRTNRLTDRVGVADHSEGFEAFYNLSLTPAAHLTFDIQVVDTPLPDIETAVILGARLNLKF